MLTRSSKHGEGLNIDWNLFVLKSLPVLSCNMVSLKLREADKLRLSNSICWRTALSSIPGGILWTRCIFIRLLSNPCALSLLFLLLVPCSWIWIILVWSLTNGVHVLQVSGYWVSWSVSRRWLDGRTNEVICPVRTSLPHSQPRRRPQNLR